MRQHSPLNLYEQYRPYLKSGDVIAFSGNSRFSKLIKLLTRSQYSHVGLVLRDQSKLFNETLLLIESTTQIHLIDANGRQAIKGVQLHLLSQRLSLYNGTAFWVPLKNPIPQERIENMTLWLRNIYDEKIPYSYARTCGIALTKIENACGIKIKPNYSTLFCSELVTRALQLAGAVDQKIEPASQTPANIVEFTCFDKPKQIK